MMGILACAAATIVARESLLRCALSWLDVGTQPEEVDCVLVLGGDVFTRPFVAASLVQSGLARRVLVPRTLRTGRDIEGIVGLEDELTCEVLRRRGVPREAITLIGQPCAHTQDEARALGDYLTASPGAGGGCHQRLSHPASAMGAPQGARCNGRTGHLRFGPVGRFSQGVLVVRSERRERRSRRVLETGILRLLSRKRPVLAGFAGPCRRRAEGDGSEATNMCSAREPLSQSLGTVLHVAHGIHLASGGPGYSNLRQCHEGAAAGWRQVLVALDLGGEVAAPPGVEIKLYRPGVSVRWGYSRRLSQELPQSISRADIVHTHFLWSEPMWAARRMHGGWESR